MKLPKLAPRIVLVLLAWGLLFGMEPGVSSAQGQDDPFTALRAFRLEEPVSAPDFTLPDLDGRAVRLADFRGKVVLLGFFTTT